MISAKEAVARKVHETAVVLAHAPGWSITTPVLFVACCAIVALLAAETVFGVLWQLGGDYRTYVSIVQ